MTLSIHDQEILRRRVVGLVDHGLLAEHRLHPFGPHSPALTEVLDFLRRGGSGVGARGPTAAHPGRGRARGAAPAPERLRRPHMTQTMGYTDRLSAAPGECVALMVSSTATRWRAELQRLHALEIPAFGVERRVESVPADAPRRRAAGRTRPPRGARRGRMGARSRWRRPGCSVAGDDGGCGVPHRRLAARRRRGMRADDRTRRAPGPRRPLGFRRRNRASRHRSALGAARCRTRGAPSHRPHRLWLAPSGAADAAR
jgi:hypothetical protein